MESKPSLPPPNVLFRPEWGRRLPLRAWLPVALACVPPFFFALDTGLPRLVAAAWAVFPAVLTGYAILGWTLRTHAEAELLEARRLGLSPIRVGSPWNPLCWLKRGFGLRIEPAGDRAAGERQEWDLALVAIAGPWANERTYTFEKDDHSPLVVAASTQIAVILAWRWDLAPHVLCFGAFCSLVFTLPFCLRTAHRAVAELSKDKYLRRFEGLKTPFWDWRFWHLHAQRARQRDLVKQGRALRLVFRVAGGIRPGSRVLELGAGGGGVWDHLPVPMRRNWLQLDLDFSALRWAKSWGRGRRWIRANGRRLPLGDGSVDAVVGLTFFDAILEADVDESIAESLRVLRPGGRLVHLQDFKNWPGPKLIDRINAVLGKLGDPIQATYHSVPPIIVLPKLGAERARRMVEELEAMEAGEKGVSRDLVGAVLEILRREPPPRTIPPNEAFRLVLKRALSRLGFAVEPRVKALEPSLHSHDYLAARKPG